MEEHVNFANLEEFEIIEACDIDKNINICELLRTFAGSTYYVDEENKPNRHLDAVIAMMEKDYKVAKISNSSGNKCFNYPMVIPIMESDRHATVTIFEDQENKTPSFNANQLEDLFEEAKLARCRQRFPVPVILFKGQFVCRSSTVASVPEVCYRGSFASSAKDVLNVLWEFLYPSEESPPEVSPDGEKTESQIPPYCEKVRNEDVKLLKALNVKTIVNIMVEKRKVKLGMYMSASETVDAERYSSFRMLSMPYPGCEFFTKFHDNLYNSDGLFYNWKDPSNNAEISVPDDKVSKSLYYIIWDFYKKWDLTVITQNYMKYLIKRLQNDNDGGLLLHCISGWDRTPLFISLIRLSLWADGLIHESLDEYDMVYFTLAYDWYLFGHHLSDRLAKNEEIMMFCFDFLKKITGDEFSAKSKKRCSDSRSSAASNDSTTEQGDVMTQSRYNRLRSDIKDASQDHDLVDVASESAEEPQPPISFVADDEVRKLRRYNETMADLFAAEARDNGSRGYVCGEPGGSTNNRLSPEGARARVSSPVSMKSPKKRQRTTSSASNDSRRDSWQCINENGSLEQDSSMKSVRAHKLTTARKIFLSCYHKTVKGESYGPPKKGVIEKTLLYLRSFFETPLGSEPDPTEESSNNDQENDE
ncbi:myotubularin-related protein 14 [Sitophilus oryzae]|uniref:Myotubularin-related protein 14 n=1 Tax=Sitophilus oryzae TaxID=7048 RepID=A0A6J2XD52_SITOR|nr:myotubularin-related protein 14 [Sitophilus oryzae]